MSFPALLNLKTPPPFSYPILPFTLRTNQLPPRQTLTFSRKFHAFSPTFQSSYSFPDDDIEDQVIGDCLVFEEGIFEDPYLDQDVDYSNVRGNEIEANTITRNRKSKAKTKSVVEIETENLVPDEWKEVQEEINITKKEKRKIRQELEFGARVEKRKQGLVPLRNLNLQEHLAYKEAKLAELKPLVLDNPKSFPVKDDNESEEDRPLSERVAPKNPRWAAYGKGFDDITEFLNSGNYVPGEKKSNGPRTLFTKEEKALLNSRKPDLAVATSRKWLPLQTLVASGDFYLVDALLKHNVDINEFSKDGWTAIHRAIISKKQAITNYLLRESANPFVRDEDGATLIHYAVQTASNPTIKILLLYNVDINLQDNDGWTPLHLAVQAKRTDIIKLLLIKGADRTLRNKDGLTPLDLCLYSGKETRTYEMIKLLKLFPKKRQNVLTGQAPIEVAS